MAKLFASDRVTLKWSQKREDKIETTRVIIDEQNLTLGKDYGWEDYCIQQDFDLKDLNQGRE